MTGFIFCQKFDADVNTVPEKAESKHIPYKVKRTVYGQPVTFSSLVHSTPPARQTSKNKTARLKSFPAPSAILHKGTEKLYN